MQAEAPEQTGPHHVAFKDLPTWRILQASFRTTRSKRSLKETSKAAKSILFYSSGSGSAWQQNQCARLLAYFGRFASFVENRLDQENYG